MILFGALSNVQGTTKKRAPGLVNFVSALAYHFCMALPAAFMQPGDHLLAEPCRCLNFNCEHRNPPSGMVFSREFQRQDRR